jgi:allantoicase
MSEFQELIDLAAEKLGGAVIFANDDFFAEKENLLRPTTPVWKEGEYTDRGKWMDGWESRRRRTPGHDFCIVRLGLPGVVRGVVVDTAFFRGNFPAECSLEGCAARADASPEELLDPALTRWVEVLPRSPLKGDAQHLFPIVAEQRLTHLRFNIFPDGGVARLRVHGEVMPDWRRLGRRGLEIDLAAIENGALALVCSDMFFGERNNMLMPGRAANMGDGWETRRRRGPGSDWAIIRLAAEGSIASLEIDTNHFKGNYPDTASVEGFLLPPGTSEASLTRSEHGEQGEQGGAAWREVLPRRKLQPHTRHFFDEELVDRGPFTHLRVNVFPDGGISRLRALGEPSPAGVERARVRRLNALSSAEATRELLAANASTAWAAAVAAARPFTGLQHLLEASDAAWAAAGEAGLREAFTGHPRIGERGAEKPQSAQEQAWASQEQAGAAAADEQIRRRLADGNRAYEARFGHIFLICASGRSAAELLAALEGRLANAPEVELTVAAEEQRKITHLRLQKLVHP